MDRFDNINDKNIQNNSHFANRRNSYIYYGMRFSFRSGPHCGAFSESALFSAIFPLFRFAFPFNPLQFDFSFLFVLFADFRQGLIQGAAYYAAYVFSAP
jgi:hypothetical protein